MDPSMKVIFDLFHQPQGELTEEGIQRRNKEGKDAAESRELGQQCLNDGDYDAAVKHFRRAAEQREADDPTHLLDLADALTFGDELPAAYKNFEKALRIKETAEPHLGLGDICKRYGRYRDAIEHLQRAIDLDPEQPQHHFKLAETLAELGEKKRALQAIQYAIALKPDESFYHFWTAELLARMGRIDEALESYRAAIELSPSDDHLYLRAAVAFWRAKKVIEAVKAIRLASDLDPDKLIYRGFLAIMLDRDGRPAEAEPEKKLANKMDAYDRDLLNRIIKEIDG